ncbi:unnamed protein product [Ilex paraguariensis]|uniref:Uncharacterized protein n=1 Tax=Ilex paraguariensis TaxID=185542 RepID=A0ABC8RZ22_9AQUA
MYHKIVPFQFGSSARLPELGDAWCDTEVLDGQVPVDGVFSTRKWNFFYGQQLVRLILIRDEMRCSVIDAVSVLGEYLKDDPWLKLLRSKLKLNCEEPSKAPDTIINVIQVQRPVEPHQCFEKRAKVQQLSEK